MKRLLAVAACAATLVLGLSRASADPLNSTTTFYFTGDCLDCTNPQGTLVLQNYTPGTDILGANFVSFTYTSNLANVFVSSADSTPEITGNLGATPGSYNFNIAFITGSWVYVFTSGTDGVWCYGTEGTCGTGGQIGIDHGTSGTFSLTAPVSSTPEPSSLILLGSGLIAVGALGRRRTINRTSC